MHIVHVFIQVKKDCIAEFREATIENAKNSLMEEGVIRFDVLQQQENATEFVLLEIYRTPEDQLKHRETEHFKKWKATIGDLILQPYSFIKYNNVFPNETGFKK